MSIETRDLLIEIGTEELPPRALERLGLALAENIYSNLNKLRLLSENAAYETYYGPRRLAVIIKQAMTQAPGTNVSLKLMPKNIAFDEKGEPTQALRKRLQKEGISEDKISSLPIKFDGKTESVFHEYHQTGVMLRAGLNESLADAVSKLPIPKRMRWGNSHEEFVRPVHWLVALFGDTVIDCMMMGITAGRTTYGHRHHNPEPIELDRAADYVDALHSAKVWLNDRTASLRYEISQQVTNHAAAVDGQAINAEPDSDLIAENAALVEWPVALTGTFDPKFLDLPEEVLIATLEDQQRYFAVRARASDRLLPHFIAISNIESKQPERVREGNERVVVPRLADAMFFWEADRAVKLETRIGELDEIVFQNKLGSLGDKMRRVRTLAALIAEAVDGDINAARRAADLAKCDLLTQLVGEFPKLQGTIGRYLAVHDGEPEEVASAIEEHYRPRFAGDALPTTKTGQAAAIADKLDTIVGIFAIGQAPTGEKDPFGLRRAALGLLRILIETQLDLDLERLTGESAATYPNNIKAAGVSTQVFDFMMERLRHYYLEQGIAVDTFEAVLARRPTRPLDFHQRLQAVEAFRKLPEAESLAAANKRIANILKQASGPVNGAVQPDLLQNAAEQHLARQLDTISSEIEPLLARSDYTGALTRLAGLRDSVDAFFDDVMVMCEDEALRDNRLALLNHLSGLFQRTADISRLQS